MASISSISDLLSLIPNDSRLLSAQGRAEWIVENVESANTTRRQTTATVAAFKAFIENPANRSKVNSDDLILYMQAAAAEKALSDAMNVVWGKINGLVAEVRKSNPDAAEKIRAWSVQQRTGGGMGIGPLIAAFIVAGITVTLSVVGAVWAAMGPARNAVEANSKIQLAFVAKTGQMPPLQQTGSPLVSVGSDIGIVGIGLLGLAAFFAFRR